MENLDSQSTTLPTQLVDGDKLAITVTAIDSVGATAADVVVVYADMSPPVVENLWLTRGDRLNVSVHSMQDFVNLK